MSELNASYAAAVASLKLIADSSVLNITEDDYEFFVGNRLWIATERARARKCVESAVYGALDLLGFARFSAPVEFVAAAIAYYVHPVNIQTACLVMEGVELSENIINGVEAPLRASEIFAHVLRVRAGNIDRVQERERRVIEQFTLAGEQ